MQNRFFYIIKLYPILLGITLLYFHTIKAQCLITNGGFEQYVRCWQGNFIDTNVINWNTGFDETTIYHNSSPDFFNQCFNYLDTTFGCSSCVPNTFQGYQTPHSGAGFAGIWAYNDYENQPPCTKPYNYRENLQTSLADSLEAGVCYHFRMYCSYAAKSYYFSPNIGAYFSDTMVQAKYNTNIQQMCNTLLPFTPQIKNSLTNYDTADWFLVEGYYTAHGGEKYIVIGNFDDDAYTIIHPFSSMFSKGCYIFIDDVSLVRCDEEQIGSEIVKLCKGDSIMLHKDNNLHPHGYCSWYDKRHKLLHNGFDYTIRPTTDTILYTIRGDSLSSCAIRYDSIIIRLINCDTIPTDTTFAFSMPTAFSPNGDGKNEVFYPVMNKAVTPTRFAIYNRWNELVYSYKNDTGWDGKYNGSNQPDGVYYYIIEINGEVRSGVVTVVR